MFSRPLNHSTGPDPSVPKHSGDAWVFAPDGTKYWGRFGASGLLAVDPELGVLLQLRAKWSHHGDTWGLPGGARDEGESAQTAALRESAEEAGVPADALEPMFEVVHDLEFWSYTTCVMRVTTPFETVLADPESQALEWIPLETVETLELHPGFAASWPALLERIRSS